MKLALYGQWEDVSGLIYTFPEKTSDLPEWAKSLFDPRNVRGIFKGDYCYALWYNNNGYYYSCIKTNTDSRNGCVMLTILAGKMVPLDGKLMVEKMRMLLDYCLSKNNYADIAYADILFKAKEIESLFTYRALMENESSMPDKEMAYRLYNNDDDLALIMENPNQHSYANYKRVLVIDKSAWGGESVNSPTITQITCPVKKTYDIRFDSNDIVVNKESVMDGETFSITYRKTGFADECVNVVVGKQNDYYHIDGNIINLKSASDVGINFKKEIILRVVDEETHNTIKTWSYKIDDNIKNNNVEDADEIVSIKLAPDSQHKITVSAEGYENNTLELAAGEHGLKTVRLHSSDDSVFVRLQLGKEEYSGSVRMKSNNKLYYPLKRLDEKNKVLQVKRGFFSRRNLLPILLVFAIAAAAGVLLGRVTKKAPKVVNNGNDSTMVAQLQESVNRLNAQINDLTEKQENNAAIDAELLPLYGKTFSLINEKSTVNAISVKDILSKPEFAGLLSGVESDKNNLKTSLNGLISQLNGVVARNNGSTNSGGAGGTHAKTEEEKKAEDLNYFATNKETWDLSQLQSNAYGNKFAGFIKDASIINLVGYTGNSDKNYYNNANWKTICEKLNEFWNANQNNKEKVDSMKAIIQTYVRENVFDLQELANFLK